MISDDEYERATRKGDEEIALYGAVSVHYDEGEDAIVIKLARGLVVHVERKLLQGLQKASQEDLQSIELDVAGIGLHIERLDWDMSIEGIMHGRYGSQQWMMTHSRNYPGTVRSGPARH